MDKSTPAESYEVKWIEKPFALKDRPKVSAQDCSKYKYHKGESLRSVAESLSRPWGPYTWEKLAVYNWGTSDLPQVNYYLEKCCKCTVESDDATTYAFADTDAPGEIWIPCVRRPPSIRFRQTCRQDIGHVALDDETDSHINTLIVPPAYAIELELGDIDALFEPIGTGGKPWTNKGVQQRLQAIGCFYQPLGMTAKRRDQAAKVAWEYYRKLHPRPDPKHPGKQLHPDDADLRATLVREVRNNIVSIVDANHLTSRAQVLHGGLPRCAPDAGGTEQTAMIRLPGAYCYSWPRPYLPEPATDWTDSTATDKDKKYDFWMYKDRFAYEEFFYTDNDLLGKIPLVATVWRQRYDGEWVLAEGVAVYFQLVDPTEPDKSPLRAPALRDKEMDYSKDWLESPTRPAGLTDDEWHTVRLLARRALQQLVGNRAAWVNNASNVHPSWLADVNAALAATTPADAAPYTLPNVGPKKFVDQVMKDAEALLKDKKDPQRYNCPSKYGGKCGLPVARNIFEVSPKRLGLHEPRDKGHADYGKLELAEVVDPVGDDHKYAVRAYTNDKGHAGVIFAPARMGGDMYRVRAYVGPPSLGFAGDNPAGPVVETGAMTVWRNIRLCGWYRYSVRNAGTEVQKLFSNTSQGTANTWNAAKDRVPTTVLQGPNLRIGETRTLHPNERLKFDLTPSTQYRPIDVDYMSVADVFRRAYCELILDVESPAELTLEQHRAAIAAARDYARRSREFANSIDWQVLYVQDFTSPWLLTVRSIVDYNSKRSWLKDNLAASDKEALSTTLMAAMKGVVESLSDHALPPGLVLFHTHCLTNASLVWPTKNGGYGFGGLGAGNGVTILAEDWANREYSIEAVTVHESGHNLFHVHAPPHPGGAGEKDAHQGDALANPETECLCIMTYRGCYGDFCGRCVLMLRGWHAKRASYATGI